MGRVNSSKTYKIGQGSLFKELKGLLLSLCFQSNMLAEVLKNDPSTYLGRQCWRVSGPTPWQVNNNNDIVYAGLTAHVT